MLLFLQPQLSLLLVSFFIELFFYLKGGDYILCTHNVSKSIFMCFV